LFRFFDESRRQAFVLFIQHSSFCGSVTVVAPSIPRCTPDQIPHAFTLAKAANLDAADCKRTFVVVTLKIC
jgi:hypothetical protein